MKSPAALSLILSSPTFIMGSSIRGLKQNPSHAKSVNIQECTGEAILPLIKNNPHFAESLVPFDSPEAAIDELCKDHHRSLQGSEAIPFSHVTARGSQFDKNYFDGGTDWNLGQEGISKVINAGRIPASAEAISSQQLAWPSYIANFDDVDSCQLRTAMCCFTKAQDPSTGMVSNIQDNLGISPNADVCTIHLDRSPHAGHVTTGKTYYSSGKNIEEETEDAYCTGFSWSQDENDISTKFRANTLFHISMMDGFYNNNLVGGVPGAPMCGCVEQMPVVSHADCVKPVQSRRLSVGNNGNMFIDSSMNFIPCNEDSLVAAYAADASNDVEALSKIVAGSCVDAVDKDLAPQGYKRGNAWWYADEEHWTPVGGIGFMYHPEISSDDFKRAFKSSSTNVIRRVCKSCIPSHRDIYYKRITPVPDSLDLLDMLKNSFSSTNNVLSTDFEMYSKDKNGLVTHWQHCNYSISHGFPYECGPEGAVTKQWTAFPLGGSYAKHMAFYIEK